MCDRRLKQAAFAMKMSVFTPYHFHRLCTSFHQHVLHWLFSSIPGVHKDTKSMLQSEIWHWKSLQVCQNMFKKFHSSRSKHLTSSTISKEMLKMLHCGWIHRFL